MCVGERTRQGLSDRNSRWEYNEANWAPGKERSLTVKDVHQKKVSPHGKSVDL